MKLICYDVDLAVVVCSPSRLHHPYSRRCCAAATWFSMPRGSVEVALMPELLAGGFPSTC
ncbi:hypothetical protein A2U01_0117432, partial [Trifolium medium]|nr:hypothetical protein [Trifolium medium]